jgi:hypothetical protein
MESEGTIQCSAKTTTEAKSPNQTSPHYHTIILNVILPSMPRSHKWSIPTRSPNQNFVCLSLQPNPPWPDHTNNLITSGEEYK